MIQIAREAETDPHAIHEAPVTTPVRRLDQTLAARQPELPVEPPASDVTAFRLLVTEPLDGAANMALDEALLLTRLRAPGAADDPLLRLGPAHGLARLRSAPRRPHRRRGRLAPGARPRAPAHRRQRDPPRRARPRADLQRGRRRRGLRRRGRPAGHLPVDRRRARAPGFAASARPSTWCRCSRRIRRACPRSASRAPARYELEVDGRKLVGSAQRRQGGGFLQHGSVMLGADAERLRRVFPGGGDPLAGMTTLEAVLGRRPSFDETVEALAEGFREAHGDRPPAGRPHRGGAGAGRLARRDQVRDRRLDPTRAGVRPPIMGPPARRPLARRRAWAPDGGGARVSRTRRGWAWARSCSTATACCWCGAARRRRRASGAFPAGSSSSASASRTRCVREVEEESGLRVRVVGLCGVIDRVVPDPDEDAVRYHYVIVDYVATVESGTPPGRQRCRRGVLGAGRRPRAASTPPMASPPWCRPGGEAQPGGSIR